MNTLRDFSRTCLFIGSSDEESYDRLQQSQTKVNVCAFPRWTPDFCSSIGRCLPFGNEGVGVAGVSSIKEEGTMVCSEVAKVCLVHEGLLPAECIVKAPSETCRTEPHHPQCKLLSG